VAPLSAFLPHPEYRNFLMIQGEYIRAGDFFSTTFYFFKEKIVKIKSDPESLVLNLFQDFFRVPV